MVVLRIKRTRMEAIIIIDDIHSAREITIPSLSVQTCVMLHIVLQNANLKDLH